MSSLAIASMPRSDKPVLVIVCGPPAAGKSTIAHELSRATGMPVIAKDAIKEAMMDHLGGSPEVGAAAFAVQFAIARALLVAGMDVILEGAFFSTQSGIAELAKLASPIVVEVSCSLEVLERRYTLRVGGDRHPGHRGLESLPDLRARVVSGAYGVPPMDGPTLAVDTTTDQKPTQEATNDWVIRRLASNRG